MAFMSNLDSAFVLEILYDLLNSTISRTEVNNYAMNSYLHVSIH